MGLELSPERSIGGRNSEGLEQEVERRRKEEEKRREELKDSEQLMRKIVGNFLAQTDQLSEKFRGDLEKVNSLDLKLLKLQKKLEEVVTENAFYSKELRRLKVD